MSRRRPRQLEIEDQSESQFSNAIQSIGWVVERLRHDYGEDLFVRVLSHGKPRNQEFFVQLKGTERMSQYVLKGSEYLSYSVDLPNLMQWYAYTLPVIFIVWDIVQESGYWIHIQPYIQHQIDADRNWLRNSSRAKEPIRKVRIPKTNIVSKKSLGLIGSAIDAQWQKIREGTRHFEMLYQAASDPTGSGTNAGLPQSIRFQLQISEKKAAVLAKPREAKNWLDLASLHYSAGNMSDALKTITNAWNLDRHNENIRQARACVLAEFAIDNGSPSKTLNEAIALFKSLKRQGPANKYNIGNSYSELNRFHEAVSLYDEALAEGATPELAAQIWTNRGNNIDKLGNEQEAIRSFQNALALAPSLWQAHASWASLEVRHERWESACTHFREALLHNSELTHDDERLGYWFAYALYKTDAMTEALSIIERFLVLRPLHEEALRLKAHLLSELLTIDDSHHAQATDFFIQQLAENPKDMLARNGLNIIYQDQGRHEQRRQLLEETATLADAPSLALFDYAILLEEEGQIEEAIRYLENAVAKDKNHLIAHNLARLLKSKGRYRDAIKYYEMALVDVDDPIAILEKIADCYYSLSDYIGCVVVTSRAILAGATKKAWRTNLIVAMKLVGIEAKPYLDFLSKMPLRESVISDQEIRAEVLRLMRS